MDEQRKRALDAGMILNAPIFAETMDALVDRAVEAWRAAKTPAEREEAWFLQRAVSLVKKELFNVLQCAAVRAEGKDKIVNEQVEKAKEKLTNGRTRKRTSK